MEQNKLTKTFDAIQDWGWFIGIFVFLALVAIVCICQAIDDFNYWKYLSAAWWFIVFYGTSSLMVYLVTDKLKTMNNSMEKLKQVNNVSVENKEPEMGTRDLFLKTLTIIGCQYELGKGDNEDNIYFAYQGENFTACTNNEARYIHIYDTHWGHVELYDIEEFARLKKVINGSNLNNSVTTVYTIDEAGSNVDVHCKSIFLFIPQIPNLEDYLRLEFNEFFRAHQYVDNEMTKLRERENATSVG